MIILIAAILMDYAHSSEFLEPITVSSPNTTSAFETNINSQISPVGGDSTELLENVPGLSLQKNGGLSSLPVIQGMADDRINIQIDGMTSSSACPNHMNPVMSYIDSSKIKSIRVLSGITAVSQGGDSIGGSIIIKSRSFDFAETDKVKQKLNLKTYFKSNNENKGAALVASIATDNLYIGYSGLDERANNYRTGGGDRLKSTLFNQNNQALDLAKEIQGGVLSYKFNRAIVPYEGFINQRMDLTDNKSDSHSLNYSRDIMNTNIDFTIYQKKTTHKMDILPSEREGEMPMNTRSTDQGYSLKFKHEAEKHAYNFGHEFIQHKLHDWWPGLEDVTVIMGPDEFVSINNGKRTRTAFYSEIESNWSNKTSTNLGIRYEAVSMNTGDVHGYNETDNLPADAAYFNSRSHSKTDHNLDYTLLTKVLLNQNATLDLGFGRKTRSPNLYERFAWAGSITDPTDSMDMESMSASMDMLMINWFGDGNGYVGNLNLKPEIAHKLSASLELHDQSRKQWSFRLTPYYSRIKDFIDANFIGTLNGNNYLQFANKEASIFGLDLSGETIIGSKLKLSGIGSYTRGYRNDGKADLYHIMPINGKINLTYLNEKISPYVGLTLVAKKNQVNELRNERETSGYALVNLGTGYQVAKSLHLGLGIENLLDKKFQLPLGGIDLVNSPTSRRAVAGMGRSINFSLTFDYL